MLHIFLSFSRGKGDPNSVLRSMAHKITALNQIIAENIDNSLRNYGKLRLHPQVASLKHFYANLFCLQLKTSPMTHLLMGSMTVVLHKAGIFYYRFLRRNCIQYLPNADLSLLVNQKQIFYPYYLFPLPQNIIRTEFRRQLARCKRKFILIDY